MPALQDTVPDTARRLRDAQRAKGLTNEELARRTGVALRTILRWRKGERPRLSNLVRVADALDVSRSYFVQDIEAEVATEDLAHEVAELREWSHDVAERLGELERLVDQLLAREMARPDWLRDPSLELSPH